MKNKIVVPFVCPAITDMQASVPSRSPAEWVISLGLEAFIRIDFTDAPTEAEARRIAFEIARKLRLRVTLDGIPLEASIRNVRPRAIAGKTPLILGGIRCGLPLLALLEPLTDLLSLCG